MQYRINKKNNTKLSVLGFGCMRFTKKGGQIYQKKADAELYRALKRGVNYFDTAYVYSGSEVALGNFVKRFDCRKKINIATKLPHYRVNKPEDFDRYFDEELSRLQTTYVDYYLMHMLNDIKSWKRLVDMGAIDWIKRKKEMGQIRNIGFSFHGGTESFKKLLDAYDWDFCQIQFNYMDEHSQAGVEGLDYAYSKDIPVIIMEPLRGGSLVNLPKAAKKCIDDFPEKHSPAYWGLRWVWNHPGVTVVLSGMNDREQVEENCKIAEESLPDSLTKEQLALYDDVLHAIRKVLKVPCTGCGYCQPCPRGVDIPNCFAALNNSYAEGLFTGLKEYFMCTVLRKNKSYASLCVECGACERKCPQHIKIRKELKGVRKRLEGIPFTVARVVASKIMKY